MRFAVRRTRSIFEAVVVLEALGGTAPLRLVEAPLRPQRLLLSLRLAANNRGHISNIS
jgi:hypothetical protein